VAFLYFILISLCILEVFEGVVPWAKSRPSTVAGCGVIEHLPDFGHWGLGSDLLFKGLRN
jgi:hypothetical protein